KMRLTSAGLRLIDKKGIDAVLVEMRARGEKV
ncbi:MAG TPA: 50S ribosomal protein L28, partial [Usitatibacter sp.]|nr:50S ribosomal protein L28 [Usitatibacter sp.]